MELQRLPYRVMGDVAMSKEPNAVGLEQVKRVDEVLENWKARTQIPKEFVVPGKAKLGVRLGFTRSVVRKAERSMVAASLAQDHLHTRSPQPPLGRTVRRSPKRRGQARTIQGIEELQAKNHAHTIGAGRVGYRVKPRSAGGRGGHRGTAMRG